MIAAPRNAQILVRATAAGIPTASIEFNQEGLFRGIGNTLALIREHAFDVINTHSSNDSWAAGVAGRISRKRPLVVRTRHLSIPIGKDFLSRGLYRRVPDLIVTTGEALRRMIIHGLRFPEERVVSIPTGIDLQRFDPSRTYPDMRSTFAIPSEAFVVGTVAVLRSWKGHEYLLEAAEALCARRRDIYFLIVGDGPGWERYNRWVRDHGLKERVILTGHEERIPEILQAIDLFALPSYASEGIPQGMIQAMAMKRPVVTCNVGAIGELVTDSESGRFVPPKDTMALITVISELANDAWQRRRLAEAGFARVKQGFDIEIMLDRTEAAYGKALKSKKGSSG
jgi:glycosyltransferase involved in cell wall biosynthesis